MRKGRHRWLQSVWNRIPVPGRLPRALISTAPNNPGDGKATFILDGVELDCEGFDGLDVVNADIFMTNTLINDAPVAIWTRGGGAVKLSRVSHTTGPGTRVRLSQVREWVEAIRMDLLERIPGMTNCELLDAYQQSTGETGDPVSAAICSEIVRRGIDI
jgi:hypothetical protein